LKFVASASHKQVWVRVNARVDQGVRRLVENLSLIPGLQTVESCQGSPELGFQGQGYVHFCYGDWRRLCSLVFSVFSPAFAQAFGGNVRLSVEACEVGQPLGMIEFDASLSEELAAVVRSIARSRYLRRPDTARQDRHRTT